MNSSQHRPPDKSKSPNRTGNEQRQPVIEQLTSSVELKRKELDHLYKNNLSALDRPHDNDDTADTAAPDRHNILKHVHFESDDLDTTLSDHENRRPPPPSNMTSTYVIQVSVPDKSQVVSSGKAKSPATKKPTKIPQHQQTTNKQRPSAIKSPLKQTTNKIQSIRPVLTYQQKRQLENEKRAQFERDVQVLRQKVLARKFAYIWLRVFFYSKRVRGRESKLLLLPSQAESYRNKQLLSKCLYTWQRDSKIQRNEWRMTVKANCHFNYVLSNKLWAIWRDFTTESKEERILNKIATDHYHSKLKVAYWLDWKAFSLNSKRIKYNLTGIQTKKDNQLISECFSYWQFRLKRCIQIEREYSLSDKHFQLVLLNKCYAIWNFKFTTGKEARRKWRLAELFHRRTLIRKCFNSVRMYARYRHKKEAQKSKLVEYAESQLVYKVFRTWSEKFDMRQKLNEIEGEITKFRNKFLTARVLQYWKFAYQFRIRLRVREIQMRRFYEKKMRKKVFEAIKANYEEARQEMLKIQRAEEFERLWIKKRYYSDWQDKLEGRNEIKTMHVAYKARRHNEKRLVRGHLRCWKEFIVEQRQLNTKLRIADDFNRGILLKNYMRNMILYVHIVKYKRENYRRAIEFERENVFSKYYSMWVYRYETMIDTQMNLRIAILHHESRVKTDVFAKWYMRFNLKFQEEINESRAEIFQKLNLMKKSFKTWFLTIQDSKQEMSREQMAANHYNKVLCKPLFDKWKSSYDALNHSRQQCLDALHHHHTKQLRLLFTAWRSHTPLLKATNRLVDELHRLKRTERLSELFSTWRQHTQLARTHKANERLAVLFHLRQSMRRILTEWRHYSATRASQRALDTHQITQFTAIKSRMLTRATLDKWRLRLEQQRQVARQESRAIDAHVDTIRRRAFSAWRVYVERRRRIHLMQRRADRFLTVRVQTECFYKWTVAYNTECVMREKNDRALLLWSISIQRRCMTAWAGWYEAKRAKKRRYGEALEARQRCILSECARRFVKYSTDERQRRFAANVFISRAAHYDSVQLQAKYFNLWASKCRSRGQGKGTSTTAVSKRVDGDVVAGASRERRERVAGESPTTVLVVESRSRPAPRKPRFLVDSVEVVDVARPVKSAPDTATILMPPTAFVMPLTVVDYAAVDDTATRLVSRDGSMESSSSRSERGVSAAGSTRRANELARADVHEKEMQLVELKKRMESLAIKSEKLK